MRRPAHTTLVNGVETSAVDIADRGLAYGDGLFETMRAVSGKIPLLALHLSRFAEGVRVLQLGSEKKLSAEFKATVKLALKTVSGEALIKVIVTRGCGGQGYTPLERCTPTVIVQVFDLPQYPANYSKKGVAVKECLHRLYHHPKLAGIKHLNRLDQVLASKELGNEVEGVLLDQQGDVIEGLKSNLLIFQAQQVVTPKLDKCGVKGTLRQFLLQSSAGLGFDIIEAEVSRDALYQASGVAMINSVFGLWPVTSISGTAIPYDERCDRLRRFIQQQLGF